MNILLTTEDQKIVTEMIDSGQYNSIGEIFFDSLSLLRERDQVRTIETAELIKELKRGVRQIKSGKRISDAKEMRLQFIAAEIKSRKDAESKIRP